MALSSGPHERRRLQPLNQQLPSTAKWAASLPAGLHVRGLLQTFPRIANAIARKWEDDAGFGEYLDELLIDRRGGRQGFPPEIQHELVLLREYRDGRFP